MSAGSMSPDHATSAPLIMQTNPKAAYLAQKSQLDAALRRVMEGGWYILGREVEAFEAAFARYIGASDGIGVASGTDAIELALRGLDIGPGDAVITVSHTAVATVAAIERCGALPVLIDIEPRTFTMDPQRLEDALRQTTRFDGASVRAVIAVHLYGHPAAMQAISAIARRYELAVVEDCAQSHGARLNSVRTGAIGDVAAFSFYPTKNLGAFGDGGMIVTANRELAGRLRSLREYGWRDRYISAEAGINSRLDEMQAALLRVRLERLDVDNARRRQIAEAFTRGLGPTPLTLPTVADGVEHAYHQYVVRHGDRDALREHLRQQQVGTGIHYPAAVHQQPAYAGRLPSPGGLAESERAAREVLSLPMYPQLDDEQVQRIIAACRSFEAAAQACE